MEEPRRRVVPLERKPVAAAEGGRSLEDQQFIDQVREKIERLTGKTVELRVDEDDSSQLGVDLEREVPLVIMGSNILEYAGFARMCIEYAVASIRQERPIDPVEFHVLLARN